MANTYSAIATTTVGGGGAANIEFTSIPQTYTDLAILLSGRGTGSGENRVVYIYPNGSSSSMASRDLFADGNAAGVGTFNEVYINGALATANVFGNAFIYIPNYTSSNNKSMSGDVVIENNATLSYLFLSSFLWSNSSAITSLTLEVAGADTFVQHSTATLYGIKKS